jgi:hypothetical protein
LPQSSRHLRNTLHRRFRARTKCARRIRCRLKGPCHTGVGREEIERDPAPIPLRLRQHGTQQLLASTEQNAIQWVATYNGHASKRRIFERLREEIATRFLRAESAAFVAGDGVDKPKGFLTPPKVAQASWAWGSLGYVASGAASVSVTTVPATATNLGPAIIGWNIAGTRATATLWSLIEARPYLEST